MQTNFNRAPKRSAFFRRMGENSRKRIAKWKGVKENAKYTKDRGRVYGGTVENVDQAEKKNTVN